jgi:integrase
MKKDGLRDSTIKNVRKALLRLAKNVSLDDSERVREEIARLNVSEGYKRNLAFAYDKYAKYYGLKWKKPKYKSPERLPRIPQERFIDMIIANSPLKLALAISMSKNTGLRPVELMNLRVRDIDLENGKVYPKTAKHGSGRVLSLKNSTLKLLSKYLAIKKPSLADKLFGDWNSDTYGKWFRYHRNKLAKKLNDLTLKSIRLYDLRHFFATMFYHKTRDLLMLKTLMGHKKIETTLIYTQLVASSDEDYVCKTARTVEEAKLLIEDGFEYVTEIDGVKLFRKRK